MPTTLIALLALSGALGFAPRAGRAGRPSSTVRMAAETETILVGCGAPKRGMGWFHALQMLNGECPAAELTHVVEPWFLGAGAEGPGGPEFGAFRDEWAGKGVGFHAALEDVPAASGRPRLDNF